MYSASSSLNYFKIFKVFGAFPVRFNAQKRQFEKQPLKWVYLCSLLLVWGLHATFTNNLITELKMANNSQRLRVVLKICQHLMTMTMMVTCYFSRETLRDTMNSFVEIERIFEENTVQFTHKPLLVFLLSKNFATITLITAITGNYCTRSESISVCFSYTWQYFLNFEILSHILSSLCVLFILSHQRLLKLNLYATNVALKGSFANVHPRKLVGFNGERPEETLRTIALLHFKLVKCSNMASRTYSFQLLAIFIFTLIRIVEDVHYVLIDSKSNLLACITELFWLVLIITDVYVAFLIATSVETAAAKTPKIVSMICCQFNSDLQNEKVLFLLQSYQQPLHLQAGGMGKLNNETFLKFWGAALTYIILLQGLETQDDSP